MLFQRQKATWTVSYGILCICLGDSCPMINQFSMWYKEKVCKEKLASPAPLCSPTGTAQSTYPSTYWNKTTNKQKNSCCKTASQIWGQSKTTNMASSCILMITFHMLQSHYNSVIMIDTYTCNTMTLLRFHKRVKESGWRCITGKAAAWMLAYPMSTNSSASYSTSDSAPCYWPGESSGKWSSIWDPASTWENWWDS